MILENADIKSQGILKKIRREIKNKGRTFNCKKCRLFAYKLLWPSKMWFITNDWLSPVMCAIKRVCVCVSVCVCSSICAFVGIYPCVPIETGCDTRSALTWGSRAHTTVSRTKLPRPRNRQLRWSRYRLQISLSSVRWVHPRASVPRDGHRIVFIYLGFVGGQCHNWVALWEIIDPTCQ